MYITNSSHKYYKKKFNQTNPIAKKYFSIFLKNLKVCILMVYLNKVLGNKETIKT